jgi:hypothetical protein
MSKEDETFEDRAQLRDEIAMVRAGGGRRGCRRGCGCTSQPTHHTPALQDKFGKPFEELQMDEKQSVPGACFLACQGCCWAEAALGRRPQPLAGRPAGWRAKGGLPAPAASGTGPSSPQRRS